MHVPGRVLDAVDIGSVACDDPDLSAAAVREFPYGHYACHGPDAVCYLLKICLHCEASFSGMPFSSASGGTLIPLFAASPCFVCLPHTEKYTHLCGWITIVIQPLYPHSQNPRFAKLSATASAVARFAHQEGGLLIRTLILCFDKSSTESRTAWQPHR